MQSMFYGMSSLTSLDLGSSFDTSNVTNTVKKMFRDASSLTSLDLSLVNFDTSKVTTMFTMFNTMSALKSLNLGDSFDTSKCNKQWQYFLYL